MKFIKSFSNLSCVGVVLMLASCASESTSTMRQAKATSGLDKFNSNYDYEKDASGLMRATSDQKSQFSSKKSFAGTRDVAGKDYNKVSYRKKRWGQKSEYGKEQFQGKKDSRYGDTPYYVKQASINQQESRFSGNEYGTTSYAKKGANMVSNGRRESNYSNATSAHFENKPEKQKGIIMSKQEYSKVSVQETNSLLGR